jgi:peptide/nickel transport system permease protein
MKRKQEEFSAPRNVPAAAPARDVAVGVLFAVLASVYAVTLILRVRWWRQLSPVEASVALAFGALLFLLWRWSRSSPGARSRFRARFAANRAALAGLAMLAVLVALVVLAPVISTDPAEIGDGIRYATPDASHPLGTDRLGRDVWARVVHGGRATLALAIVSVGLAMIAGIAVGATAGIAGRRADEALMRVVDGMLAFPRILLLLTVAALAAPGVLTLGIALAATGWMGIARIVRTEVRRLREREFVEAAIAAGVGRMGLVWRHLLPNTMGPVLVAATLNAGTVILLESSLSFLGLGVQPPAPSWGAMVFEGRDALQTAWWVSAAPAVAITMAAVGFNLVGDGLRDAFNARATSVTPG